MTDCVVLVVLVTILRFNYKQGMYTVKEVESYKGILPCLNRDSVAVWRPVKKEVVRKCNLDPTQLLKECW